MSSVDRDLTTKDKTKEITNPTKPRNEVGGKNDRPKKDETFPSPTKKKAKVLQIPPTILNEDIKTSSFTPLAILSKGLQPIKTNFNKETNYNKIVGPDPFRFIITSNKDSVAVGEEIELTIAVDWVDFGINNGVRFLPEWYKYTLRVVTPKGFTQTGGDYTDFCTKPVDANNPQAVFTIKGKFEYQPEEAKFTVLRGFEGADERSDFIWKENFEVRIRNSIINPRNKNSRIANACEDNNSLIKDEITGTAGWTLPPSANNWTHFRSPDTWLSGGDVIWRTKITTVPTSSNGGKVAGFYGLAYPTTPASIEEMETKSEFTFEKGKAYYIRFEQAKFDYSGTGEAIGNGKIFVRINGVDYKSNNNATTNFQPVIIGPIYFTNDTKSKIRTGVLLEPGHFNATYILLDDLVVFSVSKPQISASPTSISSGNKSTITLTGCPSTATVSWTNYASTGNPIDVYPTTTTTYKAQCTEANGCVGDWSNEVTVTVTTPPCAATKPSITGSTTGCSSVKLSINKVTGETYTWYEGTTNKGAGTDSPDGTKVEFPASTIGLKSYTVKASVTGCSATSNAKDVTITSTPAAPSVVQEDHSTTQFKLTVSGCDGGSLSWDDDIGSGNPIYVVKNVTATYKVKCTVGTCVSGWSNEIVVTNTPACTLIKPGRTKTDNTCSVTLTASSDASNGVVEYQWQKENGTYGDISGQTASTLTLTETGNYRVVISKAGCTSGTSDPYNVSTIPSVAKPAASDVSYDVGQSPSALTATTINADYTLTWWGESSTGGTPSTSAPTPSTAVAGTIYYYVSQYKTNTTACESPRTKITVNVTDPVCNVAKPTNTSVTPDKITSGQNPSIALGGDCTGSSTLYWKKSGTTDAWSSAGSTNVSVATTFDFRCQEGTCNSLNGESKSVSLNGGVTFKTITPSNTSDCASADGSVIALAEGGKGSGYSYKLLKSDGVTVERTYQSSGTFTGLRSGTYYVQAKDGDDTESAVSSVSILSPSAPGKPTFSPASATINDGDSYNITTPTCSSSSPEWKTTFVNPVKISGYFKAICIDGECSSAESTFTLTVNGKTITIDETTSPNCFNRGGTIKVTVSGTGAFTYALYDVNAGSFITGKNAYAGTTHTFTGLSEGKYKVYVTPDGTAPTINSEEVTLTKDCSGGYTITDVVSPGCFGKNGSFKVTVSNPTAGIGYLYTLIDATNPDPSRGILSTKNGGSTYTFTGLTKGLYRVDITEDRANGGVIWGDTRADLTTLGCISGGLVIDQNSRVKANCIGLGGGFTVSIESPTAGIGYVYTLINTATGQSVIGHINVYDGSSHTFTGLAFGTYRVDVQEDIPGNAGGIINGNQTVTIEKDCSDFAVTISELIPVNCTNTGDGKIRITGLPSLSIPAVGMYRYTLFESYISPFRDPVNIYPVRSEERRVGKECLE